MASNKKSVLLYCDIIHTVEKMDNATAGKFFKHYLRYINDLHPETDDMIVDIAFESVKQNLKRDLKKWEQRAENSRTNGKLGGRPKKPKEPNGLINNLTEPKEPVKDTVTVTVTDKVIEVDNTTTKVEGFDFSKLLEYINTSFSRDFRTINQSVKAKYKARLKDGYTKDDVMNAILNCKNDSFHKELNYKHCTPEYFSRANTLDLHSEVKEVKAKNPQYG